MTLLVGEMQQNVKRSEPAGFYATNCKPASFPDQAETKL